MGHQGSGHALWAMGCCLPGKGLVRHFGASISGRAVKDVASGVAAGVASLDVIGLVAKLRGALGDIG